MLAFNQRLMASSEPEEKIIEVNKKSIKETIFFNSCEKYFLLLVKENGTITPRIHPCNFYNELRDTAANMLKCYNRNALLVHG